MKIQLRASPAPWWHGVNLLAVSPDGKGVLDTGGLLLKEVPDSVEVGPTFHMDLKEAQVLMDDLWASGIRPTDGKATPGALKATERHLEDMRKIVFDHLKQM